MVAFINPLLIAVFLALFLPVTAYAQPGAQESYFSLTVTADPSDCARIEGGGKYLTGSKVETRYYGLANDCRLVGHKVSQSADNFGPGCDISGSGE